MKVLIKGKATGCIKEVKQKVGEVKVGFSAIDKANMTGKTMP